MYRSGRFLVARQLIGLVIKLVGILVVTRLIGPEAYGLFAAVAAVAAVLATIAVFGIDVQLVRSPGSAADDTAFAVLVGSSVVIGGLAALAAPLLGSWLQDDGVVAPMRTVAVLLPLLVIGAPARARLERELRFDVVARNELAADIAVYVVSIPLAVAGAGVWAPIAGLLARNAMLVVTSSLAARYLPRPVVDRGELVALARFGTGYSAAKWFSLVGRLVNPIVVGRVLGPVGVGHVAVASRIVEQLGAAKQATMRLAIAAFAKLGDDRDRLRAAHAEGVLVQVVGSVPLYAAAAFLAPWLVPTAFGQDWAPAAELLGLLAIAASVGTLFNLGPPFLQVRGRNGPVVRLRGLQVASLLGFTLLLVPPLGVVGYGLARLIRTIPFLTLHRELLRWFQPTYRSGARWVLALLPVMTAAWWPGEVRPVLLFGPVALASLPSTRRELRSVVAQVVGRHRSSTTDAREPDGR
ncbi:MAG: oligosaccharide flippase family protein [Actinomycetota bacterium]